MTLPASGAISLGQLRTEFKGGSAAISMSEMYRSGTYVPPLTANAGIPTSGVIDLQDFYSASVSTAMAASYYGSTTGIKGGGSTNTFTITSAGVITGGNVLDVLFSDNWCAYSAAPGNWYQVYVTKTSGATPTGDALDTWLDLSTTRNWTINSPFSTYLDVTIRHKYNTASTELTSISLDANA